jgi:hypothetical protein
VLQDSDLTPAERALCSAAAVGRLLDTRTRHPDEDDPANGRTWGKDRQIRAQVLRQLLTGQGCLDQTFGRPLAVRLRGASVSGRLNLGGLPLRCPLELYGCYLGGRLDLAKAEAPDISLRGSHLMQRLSGRYLRLTHNLSLTGGFRCHGRTDLRYAHIGGTLDGEQATLTNPNGEALTADGLTVDGDVFLHSAQVTGELRLLGAKIGGQLVCKQATFTNPRPVLNVNGQMQNTNGRVLFADRLTVDASMLLNGARVTGELRLLGAKIGGQLVCDQATLTNPGGAALILARASITGAVLIHPAGLAGSIDLTDARVGGWSDDQCTWPTALLLEGFVCGTIDAPNIGTKQRLEWLRLHKDGYLPQPYEQLAGMYRRAGNDQDTRTVAIAKQKTRRAQVKPWWARWLSQAWSCLLRVTIGYGYRPALVLPYLAGLFAIGCAVFNHAYPNDLRPAKSGPEQLDFNPARYTLDLLLPVANLHQREAFVPHGYAAWWAFGLTLTGWLLAAVVVAGLTGVFKRD